MLVVLALCATLLQAAAAAVHDYTVRLTVILDASATPPTRGEIDIEVHPDWAPLGAARFKDLVSSGYFDGAAFFRVIPGFVAQMGIAADPAITAAWRERKIVDDPVDSGRASNKEGYVSFATSGPNSRTTQWFVNLGNNRRLDAMGFAPFGRVVRGMDAVRQLYGGYGEAPRQASITREGEPYLAEHFPRLAHIAAQGGAGFVERKIVRLYAPDIAAHAAACTAAGERCETPLLLRQEAGATAGGGRGMRRRAGPLIAVFGAQGPRHTNRIHDKLLEVPLFPERSPDADAAPPPPPPPLATRNVSAAEALAPGITTSSPSKTYSSFRAHIVVRGDFCRPDIAALTNGALPAVNVTALLAGGSSGRFALAQDTAPTQTTPIDPHGEQLGSAPTAAARETAAAAGAAAASDCDFVVGISDGTTVWAVGRGTDGNDALVPFPDASQRPDTGVFYHRFGAVPPYKGGDFHADVGYGFNASHSTRGVAMRVFDEGQPEPPPNSAQQLWFFEPSLAAAVAADAVGAADPADPADAAHTRIRMPNGALHDLRLVAYRDDPPQAYALREIAVELEYVVTHGLAPADAPAPSRGNLSLAAENVVAKLGAAAAGRQRGAEEKARLVAADLARVAEARERRAAREAREAMAAAEALGEADRNERLGGSEGGQAAVAAGDGIDELPLELPQDGSSAAPGGAAQQGDQGHSAGHVADMLITAALLMGAVAFAAHDLKKKNWRSPDWTRRADEIQMLATSKGASLRVGIIDQDSGGDLDEHV